VTAFPDTGNDPYGLNLSVESTLADPDFTGRNCVKRGTVKLQMDFRDHRIMGTFLARCHILEHEDKGMMAEIRLN
jgi:FtsP/CotA-like multicopper oxidase with cupredoxin domain